MLATAEADKLGTDVREITHVAETSEKGEPPYDWYVKMQEMEDSKDLLLAAENQSWTSTVRCGLASDSRANKDVLPSSGTICHVLIAITRLAARPCLSAGCYEDQAARGAPARRDPPAGAVAEAVP